MENYHSNAFNGKSGTIWLAINGKVPVLLALNLVTMVAGVSLLKERKRMFSVGNEFSSYRCVAHFSHGTLRFFSDNNCIGSERHSSE